MSLNRSLYGNYAWQDYWDKVNDRRPAKEYVLGTDEWAEMADPGQMIQYGLWKYDEGDMFMFVRFFWEFPITTATWDPSVLPETVTAQFSFEVNNGETDSDGNMTVSAFNCILRSRASNTYSPWTSIYWPDSTVETLSTMSQWPDDTPVEYYGGRQSESGSWYIDEKVDAGGIMGDETFYAYVCEGRRPLSGADKGDIDIEPGFLTYVATFQNWFGEDMEVGGDKIQQSGTFMVPEITDDLFVTLDDLTELIEDTLDIESHASNFLTVSAIALGTVAGMLM